MPTSIHSFSYRHPPDLPIRRRIKALVVDVRCLANPYVEADLRLRNGLDRKVQEWIRLRSRDFESWFLKLCRRVGETSGEVWIGCQGGRHRSVFIAEELGRVFDLTPTHEELEKWTEAQDRWRLKYATERE